MCFTFFFLLKLLTCSQVVNKCGVSFEASSDVQPTSLEASPRDET